MPLPEPVRAATQGPPAPSLPPERWRLPFRPLFRQPDLQTVAARYWPRSLDTGRHATTTRLIRTDPDTTVLVRLNLAPDDAATQFSPTVLAVHGLTACDRAPYMVTAAQTALDSGFEVARMNVRNCGGTEHLCRTLYHSGLTTDLRAVADALAPRPLYILGFSMGGNMALKLAGEWGASAPEHVRAVCAISPPIQLAMCSRKIGLRRNYVYEKRFLRQLAATMRRKSRIMPEVFPESDLGGVRNIWQFDEEITAPAFGFRDAADYYRQCSAAAFVGRIRTPTLIIQARDDPFIPFEAFDVADLDANPSVALASPPHGGHVAFLARGSGRFWAHRQAMRFFEAVRGPGRPRGPE